MSSPSTMTDRLLKAGIIYPTMMGIQIDLNPAWRPVGDGFEQASFCNYDCTQASGGGYDCPAAKSRNVGIVPTSMARFDELMTTLAKAMAGQRQALDLFMKEDFEGFCELHGITGDAKKAVEEVLRSSKHEVNLFGGNPEVNDAAIPLIKALRSLDVVVNLTTVGGRCFNPRFVSDLVENPPNRLALSADDLTPEEVVKFTSMTVDELKIEHGKPGLSGQDRKAIAGIAAAKIADATPGFPPILYNMVISERNLANAKEVIAAMERALPNVIMNPYPGQSSFFHQPAKYNAEQVSMFHDLLAYANHRTFNGGRFVARAHFWWFLKAGYDTWPNDVERISRHLSGYDGWRCYRGPIWYLQIGRSESKLVSIKGLRQTRVPVPVASPGQHMGCFWNAQTVTQDSRQVTSISQVSNYMRGGAQRLASQAADPCPGCVMPRLVFHEVSLLGGMDPDLRPAYYRQRQEHLGF